jgi:hypothetical protein
MARLRSGGMLTLAATGYVVATALSAYLLGNGIAIFLLGACLFVLLLALFESTLVHWPAPMRMARWLSDHTLDLPGPLRGDRGADPERRPARR